MSNQDNQSKEIKETSTQRELTEQTNKVDGQAPLSSKENESVSRAARRKADQEKEKTKGVEDAESEKSRRKEHQKGKRLERKKLRVRLIPIWLRLLIVIVLSLGFIVAGLMIGYGVIGGGKPSDVLKQETWQHIIDVVKKGK